MFYLKVLFLVSYFVIIFILCRVSSSLNGGNLKINVYGELLSSFTSIWDAFIHGNDGSSSKKDYKQSLTETFKEGLSSHANKDVNYQNINDDNIEDINKETVFNGYEDFIEKVEDTKASVWVVTVYPPTNSAQVSEPKRLKDWSSLSRNFRNFGIKTGKYQCVKDIRLCLIHKITTPMVLLSMPKGSHPKANVAFHVYNPIKENFSLMTWVQKKLHLKVKMVHSISELKDRPVGRRLIKNKVSPSLYFVYQAKEQQDPPLLLSALSVRFTGRVKFYMLKTKQEEPTENLFSINQFSKYSYGKHKGENFTYSCMELFFRTLHPEVNDIFIVSLIVLNMACWFEVSLQKGGPLRRLLFYIWGFATSNILLVTIWLPLLKVIYMPEVQPIVEMCLQNLQKIMFTNLAAIIRQDFLEISKHVYFVVFGFVLYGIFLGYLHFKFRDGSDWASNTSISEIFEHDLEDIQNIFRTFVSSITPTLRIYRFEARIERILNTLSTSQIWLPTETLSDSIKELPTWKHCNSEYSTPIEDISGKECFGEKNEASLEKLHHKMEKCPNKCLAPEIPDHIYKVHNCVICLEEYKCQNVILGLPCGHSFHQSCLYEWFMVDGAQNKCPICRWPCYLKKGTKFEIVDTLE